MGKHRSTQARRISSQPSLRPHGRLVADRLKDLGRFARSGRPRAAQHLISALADRSSTVRWSAAEYLGSTGSEESVQPLINSLHDPNNEVRMMAARSLGNLLVGQRSPAPLVSLLRDRDELVRIEACESLRNIGDRGALPALWRAIRDDSELVRSYAATAIGSLGAREEIARLETAFRRENSDQGKVGFYEALYKLRRNAALAPLLELLQNPDYQVRCATANTLSTLSFGRQDASVVLAALRRAPGGGNCGRKEFDKIQRPGCQPKRAHLDHSGVEDSIFGRGLLPVKRYDIEPNRGRHRGRGRQTEILKSVSGLTL
jgi:HEAT repeat protein